jgi:cytochrome c oxidase assembly protein subunit 15
MVDLGPAPALMGVAALLAAGLLAIFWARRRAGASHPWRLALTVFTLFLTFDLVLFGAFTRLTDSGLGCPDWPGCYGTASPLAAHADIAQAQAAMPDGPVTHAKAWIEMLHRYLASGVGALILVLALAAWRPAGRSHPMGMRLPLLTLVWVCVQGAFGALTVTQKLQPLIVSLHLLGAYALLALLTMQVRALGEAGEALAPRVGLRPWLWLGLLALLAQAALGAWVSTNYAVLVCADFPTCQGSWWPDMDFASAYTLMRPLGLGPDGAPLGLEALTAIHMVHRVGAMVLCLVLLALLWRMQREPGLRRAGRWLASLLALQVLTGLSNVVLGWPLVAAVLHTGGAGALVVLLVWLLSERHGTSAAID